VPGGRFRQTARRRDRIIQGGTAVIMSVDAPHKVKLIANVAILTPDRALLVKYAEGHDGDPGWMLADDLLADREEPDAAATRVLTDHVGLKGKPRLVFVESFTGGDGTWHLAFNYAAEFSFAPPVRPSAKVAGTGWFMLSSLPRREDLAHRGWAASVLQRIVAARA